MGSHTGVVFRSESTSKTARDVLAAALASVDESAAEAVRGETNWRKNYPHYFRQAVELGLDSPDAAIAIANAGLGELHDQFEYIDSSGTRLPLDLAILEAAMPAQLETQTLTGRVEPETDFTLPYRGERLSGTALFRQLDAWVERGIITSSCSEAIHEVADHPEWLRLDGDTVVVLGAAAEMAPTRALLRWGARVAAVDLPRHGLQETLENIAANGAGEVLLPDRVPSGDDAETGADLVHELPELSEWLHAVPGRAVLGGYCYADGATHVRVAMAGDALAESLIASRPDSALAFLATPTDVFAVDKPELTMAANRLGRTLRSRALRPPLRLASGGRLLQRNYPRGAFPGICDALVTQQGPNYALAKRIHRWRSTVSRAAGNTVSMNVAPATRTRSVVKNRALAAAYGGAHRFGVEVFDPATSSTLMAALLVHDLRSRPSHHLHPWQDEADQAVHGGLWTSPYAPRSALGLAAVMGVGGARH